MRTTGTSSTNRSCSAPDQEQLDAVHTGHVLAELSPELEVGIGLSLGLRQVTVEERHDLDLAEEHEPREARAEPLGRLAKALEPAERAIAVGATQAGDARVLGGGGDQVRVVDLIAEPPHLLRPLDHDLEVGNPHRYAASGRTR